MIEAVDLTKNYGAVKALRGVSLTVQPGEIVGLLGPNGAGKSTLMRIATGFLAPTSGSVTVDGVEVLDDTSACQRKIGYLPEGNPLYLDMRLRDMLRFAANARGLRGDDRSRSIAEAIRDSGLQGKEHKLVSALSRGFRQRVGLAMALLHRPQILILDEPSSGLDPNQQAEMRRFIRGLGESRTVVFSTHILAEVEAICDRVVIISNGLKAADGTVDEIRAGAQAQHALRLVIRGDADAARTRFEGLPFADSVSVTRDDPEPGLSTLVVHATEPPTVGMLEATAESAVEGRLGLVLLEIERPDLEDAFAQLTQAGTQGASVAGDNIAADNVAADNVAADNVAADNGADAETPPAEGSDDAQ